MTNFSFGYLVLLVLGSLGLGVFFFPFEGAINLGTFFALLVGINVVGAVIANIFRAKFVSGGSIWLQPVSTKFTSILVNGVVAIWLGIVGLLMIMLLEGKETITIISVAILFFLNGIGSGLYIQKRNSWNFLLPYGVGFLGALLLSIVIIAGSRVLDT